MKTVRLIFFIILIPGTVAVVIPRWLMEKFPQSFDIGSFRFIAVPVFIFGLVIFCWSVLSLFVKGGGTPAIYFTKQLSFLIGEEPAKLVSQGPYRYSRNPMYVGVMSVVLAAGLYYQSYAVVVYTIFLFLFFSTGIIFFEEPHLKKKFGKEYEDYLKSTPRWFGAGKNSMKRNP